eukprot:11072230-Heterocapsa_arctica.AAC.1
MEFSLPLRVAAQTKLSRLVNRAGSHRSCPEPEVVVHATGPHVDVASPKGAVHLCDLASSA